jgi:hypothetical protein
MHRIQRRRVNAAEPNTAGPSTGDRRQRGRAAVVAGLVGLGAVGASLVAPTTGAGAAGRSGTFSALSYNVAGLPEPLSGSEPATNTPQISPKLNQFDLVMVQEDWIDPVPPVGGFDFHHDDLVSQAHHPYQSTPAPPPLGNDPTRPSALIADGLNMLSQFPLDEPVHVRWPNCFGGIDTSDGGAADCLATKGFTLTHTTFAPGVVIDVYNLHGEAGSTPADQLYSAEDFVVLADYINAHSAGRPIILGGDTNLHSAGGEDKATWDTFRAATGISDVCEVLDCGADDHRIDKFAFRNGAGITIEPLSHAFETELFARDPDGEPLSDHDALHVDFRWTADTLDGTASTSSSTSTPATRPGGAVATPVAVAPRFTG